MRKKITEQILEFLEKQEIIEASERELYRYGINQVLLFVVNMFTTILIGVMMDMIVESILFSCAYIPLRRFAGGYHAVNAKVCYLMSTVLTCIVLFLINYITLNIGGYILTMICTLIVICVKAPVDSSNKRLSYKEKQFFGKYARIIATVELIICIVFLLIGYEIVAKCFWFSLIVTAIIILIPEKQKNNI
jgi:accessory gene regulator B